jgi:uncharacterized protein Smg (DUF494 family)
MTDRLIELLSRLREQMATGADVADVEALLASEGYDRRQIGEILALLFPDISAGSAPREPGVYDTMTFRVMGPHERARFAPEAWGHLLSLTGSGVLSPAELERVIERAMVHFEGRILLDDVRSIIEASGPGDPPCSSSLPFVFSVPSRDRCRRRSHPGHSPR